MNGNTIKFICLINPVDEINTSEFDTSRIRRRPSTAMNSLMELLKLYLFFVILRTQSRARHEHSNFHLYCAYKYTHIRLCMYCLHVWSVATTTTTRSVLYQYFEGCLSTRWKRYSPILYVCMVHIHAHSQTRVIRTKTVS